MPTDWFWEGLGRRTSGPRGQRSRRAGALLILVLAVLFAGPGRSVLAAVIDGGSPRPAVDNFGRGVNPHGRLTELGYFVTGSAITPDGRFLWTIGAGRVANDIQITRTSDGKVIQTIADPAQALQGGVVISPDGRSAYVADTHDNVGVRAYTIDQRTGLAEATRTIPLPPPAGTAPPDDFPPRSPSSGGQSYASGMAITSDGATLVVSENLDDRAAIVNTATGSVTQVTLKTPSPSGSHAMPEGVAIIGRQAYVANEGDGTVASFSVDNPGAGVTTVTPTPSTPDPAQIDATKTHPFQIVASPDGKALYVSETNADRVMVLDPGNLSAPAGVIYVRRPEGLGTSPLGMSVTPDGSTLFVADANENAVRAIALSSRDVRRPDGSTVRVDAGDEIARLPSGIYPDRVEVDHHSGRLYVVSAEGVGAGPTSNSNQIGNVFGDQQQSSIRMLSMLQTFALPLDVGARDTALVSDGAGGAQAAVPVTSPASPPAATPVIGSGGAPSGQIKYVFYVVAENKTYDSMLGDLSRDPNNPLAAGGQRVGNGDPCVVIFGETRSLPHNFDGSPCPQSRFVSKDPALRNPGQIMDGTPITPNQHKIARQFVALDNVYADSTTSDDGHLFTASGYSSDYELRGTEANNGPSPRPFDLVYPQAAPPKGFLFDAMARSGVSFFNYGEAISGTLIPDAGLSPTEQATRKQVLANSDYTNYPSSAAIGTNPFLAGQRVDDANQSGGIQNIVGQAPNGSTVPARQSRMQFFENKFATQIGSCTAQTAGDPTVCKVPQFNELILPNNHTAGTTPGLRTPDALVRDNDLAIGQLADVISHSPIWRYSAIFVVQDDSQDGADHLDAHRITSYLISPYAKRQTVDSTHYDQASVIHTMEMILGVHPQYFQDALATPMYNAFISTPDLTPYDVSNIPQNLLDEVNGSHAPMASTSAAQLWQADHVDPNLVNKILWSYRYGTAAACPSGLGAAHANPCQTPAGASGAGH